MKYQKFSLANPFSKTLITFSSLSLIAMNFAQATETENIPSLELDPIVITATRTPTKTSNLIAQTTVIDEVDLQRYQGQTVLDVIQDQAGFNIKQNGGMGTSSNFYLRGYDSKSVLVLIDGIRYGSISTGQPMLSLLPTDQVERIEVLHGASGSSIYGADAVGGVIQIFTKGSTGIVNSGASLSLGYGSHNLATTALTGQYTHNKTSVSLGIGYEKTDGFNAITNAESSNYHSDNDSYESKSASLSITHQLNSEFRTGLTAMYNDSVTDFDSGASFPDANSEQKNGSTNAYIEYLADDYSSKLSIGQSVDNLISHDQFSIDYDEGSQFKTTQQQIRFENKAKLHSSRLDSLNSASGEVVMGIEYLSQRLDASDIMDWSDWENPAQVSYQPKDRNATSGFMGYQLNQDKVDFQLNYRLDNNSQYGTKDTYNVGFAVHPMKNTRIGGSYSTGFRMPTFNDLYYPGANNPNLTPETSKNTEVFAEYDNDLQRTRLTAYRNDVDDMLLWNGSSMKNIAKAELTGVSLTSDWQMNDWLFGMGYDYLESKNLDESLYDHDYDYGAVTPEISHNGNELVYRPEHAALAYIGYQADKFDVRVEGKYVGDIYSDSANTTQLDSHTLVNLNGNYYMNDSLTAGVRINNATDEDYTTIKDYATDGRNFLISLKYDY